VVLLEPRAAYRRDRTWCGWRVGPEHPFTAAVTHRWTQWAVQDGRRRVVRGSARHPYEHVSADVFYAVAQAELATVPQVELRLGVAVHGARTTAGTTWSPRRRRGRVRAAVAFDSRPAEPARHTGVEEVALLQNFVGWEVDAGRAVFDPEVVEMMDFAVSQARGLHFMYVLPFSPRRALIEATYITPGAIAQEQCEADIRGYLQRRHGVADAAVMFRERGQIAMSTAPARPRGSPRVVHIGLRGGLAKPSTGYAFAAIQEFSATLAGRIVARPGAWWSRRRRGRSRRWRWTACSCRTWIATRTARRGCSATCLKSCRRSCCAGS
jgi:lycopene beta-cyclase